MPAGSAVERRRTPTPIARMFYGKSLSRYFMHEPTGEPAELQSSEDFVEIVRVHPSP